MEPTDLQRWLDDYVRAWESYGRDEIGALFSEDATYRYHPWDEPVVGRAAIVEDWLSDRDSAGSFRARYEPHAIDE
ncbi:MAG: nuclear transport factor 2 family protein, partial [Actinomycetota bacterium]